MSRQEKDKLLSEVRATKERLEEKLTESRDYSNIYDFITGPEVMEVSRKQTCMENGWTTTKYELLIGEGPQTVLDTNGKITGFRGGHKVILPLGEDMEEEGWLKEALWQVTKEIYR